MIEVVKAGLNEYDTILALAKKVWPQTYKKILSQEQIEYMMERMYSLDAYTEQISIKGHHFLLVKEESEFLGFASYEPNSLSGATKIHKIYVIPEAQGRSIGKLLISKIESAAKRNNNDRILLNVNRYNEAVNFYLKIGFTKAGEEDIDIGNGYLMEDFIMQKWL
ncbi:MAG: GNAT family N-acetyltransferase [Flavobacterium sp.]|nr:MAG: GNAT family N-acetyltransferase [Flavobacterium sp.]